MTLGFRIAGGQLGYENNADHPFVQQILQVSKHKRTLKVTRSVFALPFTFLPLVLSALHYLSFNDSMITLCFAIRLVSADYYNISLLFAIQLCALRWVSIQIVSMK